MHVYYIVLITTMQFTYNDIISAITRGINSLRVYQVFTFTKRILQFTLRDNTCLAGVKW
jgi:hypothetical protein